MPPFWFDRSFLMWIFLGYTFIIYIYVHILYVRIYIYIYTYMHRFTPYKDMPIHAEMDQDNAVSSMFLLPTTSLQRECKSTRLLTHWPALGKCVMICLICLICKLLIWCCLGQRTACFGMFRIFGTLSKLKLRDDPGPPGEAWRSEKALTPIPIHQASWHCQHPILQALSELARVKVQVVRFLFQFFHWRRLQNTSNLIERTAHLMTFRCLFGTGRWAWWLSRCP